MKLSYVIIYVDDVAKALEFYDKAFGMKTKFLHESGTYGETESGETVLAFAHNDMLKMHTGLEALKGPKRGFEIAFTADDVEKSFSLAVESGCGPLVQPSKKPWGQTVAYVQDPFGTIVEICTPMA